MLHVAFQSAGQTAKHYAMAWFPRQILTISGYLRQNLAGHLLRLESTEYSLVANDGLAPGKCYVRS